MYIVLDVSVHTSLLRRTVLSFLVLPSSLLETLDFSLSYSINQGSRDGRDSSPHKSRKMFYFIVSVRLVLPSLLPHVLLKWPSLLGFHGSSHLLRS